jgi:endonuclease YncB( thermonuclease family)
MSEESGMRRKFSRPAVAVALVALGGAGVWMARNSISVASAVNRLPVPGAVNGAPAAEGEQPAGSPVLVGTVMQVIDGDTVIVQLESGPIRVRLGSIDAPEQGQPWGIEAKDALARKLGHQRVMLDVATQDQYERVVAVVTVGTENVNQWMVEEGHAWAYRNYLHDQRYCALEGDARAERRGLWGMPAPELNAPWEWRAVARGRAEGFTDHSKDSVVDCVAAMRRPARS